MAITNQAEADAYRKASEENKILSEQYYNAFKQTVKNSNAQYDIIQSQLAPLKDDSTIEGLQKKIELRKNLAEIVSASIADSKTYFQQMNDLSSAGYGQTDNRSVYLKNMADNIKLQQAAIDSNDKKIANLETTLNQITSKQSATEEEIAKAKAADDATKPAIDGNTTSSTTASSQVVDDDKGQKKDVQAGLKASEVTTPDVAKTTTAAANQSKQYAQTTADANNGLKVDITGTNTTGSGVGLRDFNPLSKNSDYTYNITLSLAEPSIFNRYMEGDKSAIDEAPVLIRSGGTSLKRAPGFELDCYIDELEINTKVNSKDTASASNSMGFKFKIFEPYGFSVPTKLAALTNRNASGLESFRGTFFLSIKFYGYGSSYLRSGMGATSTTPYPPYANALHERTFCIYITKVNFKLDKGLVVYEISAVPSPQNIAFGNRGEVKANKTIQGTTVSQLLIGDSSNKQITSLVDVLNSDEKKLKDDGKVEIANVYKIEIWDTEIGDAELVSNDFYTKEKTPMASGPSNDQTSENNKTSSIQKKFRTLSIPAGDPVLKVIDRIISQSTFARKALNSYEIEDPIDENTKPISNSSDEIVWYNVTPTIKFLTTGTGPKGKDAKRNDFAYEITYRVQTYKTPYIRSVYASKTLKYYGPYKKYDYWYTGQNTEVLSFDMNYDFAYQVDVAMNSKSPISVEKAGSSPLTHKTGQVADNNGKDDGTNEQVNSIRSWLYSPGDNVKWNLTILGDPDYLMPAFNGTAVKQLNRWYGEDFTINPGTGQIFIEIDFKQGEDYDKDKGLLITDDKIKFMDYPSDMNPKGFVFIVVTVISTFSRGKFEQRLTGGLPEFSSAPKSKQPDQIVSQDSNPGRSAGYDSPGTNTGVASPSMLPGVTPVASFGYYPSVQNQPPATLPGVQQTAQFGNYTTYSSAPALDTITARNANDDQTSNNQSPITTNNEGGREPVYKEDVAFGRGNTPAAAGQRNVIPTLG